MNCPCCGGAVLARDTRDLSYTRAGKTLIIPAVTGQWCPVCGETVLDDDEAERVSLAALAFNQDSDDAGGPGCARQNA